jgi:hypothetical protein
MPVAVKEIGPVLSPQHRPLSSGEHMAHWFTHREHGLSVERAVIADYDLSVMRVADAAYWLVARDGRDVAEGEAATPERARWCAEVEAELPLVFAGHRCWGYSELTKTRKPPFFLGSLT